MNGFENRLHPAAASKKHNSISRIGITWGGGVTEPWEQRREDREGQKRRESGQKQMGTEREKSERKWEGRRKDREKSECWGSEQSSLYAAPVAPGSHLAGNDSRWWQSYC